MLKIEYDEKTGTISVGKAIFKRYVAFENSKAFAQWVLRENGHFVPVYKSKEQNKIVADTLGCSRTQLFKHFMGLQNKVWVAPIYHILLKVGRMPWGKKRFNPAIVQKCNLHKFILQEVYDDGLYNLLPIVMYTGQSPKELKKKYKGTWKIISNNSLAKNKNIVSWIFNDSRHIHSETEIELSSELVSLPSTLLKYKGWEIIPACRYLAENFKGKWSNRHEMYRHYRLFVDTNNMAARLGATFDPKWSPRRMKEEHDKMSQEIRSGQFSTAKFKWLDEILSVFEHEGYTAVLLDNARAIADEGSTMGHCVSYYAGMVSSGDYLVYSIRKGFENSSTLGITVEKYEDGVRDFSIQQHYGKYNADVKDEKESEIAKLLVEQLNKLKQEGAECA